MNTMLPDYDSVIPEYGSDGLVLALAIYVIVLVLLLIWSIVNYILRSKSLYTIAKRRQIPKYGFAWVPCLYVWTLGSIADQYDYSHGMKRRWRIALLVFALIIIVSSISLLVFTVSDLMIPLIEDTSDSIYESTDPSDIVGFILPMYALMIPMYMAMGALGVCNYICTYKLYESCKPEKALTLLLVSLLVPFAAPFCLMSCRKWDNGVLSQPQGQISYSTLPTYENNQTDS